MSLTMNYQGLQYKYSKPKKKNNNEDKTNIKLGKSFFTASQWLDYKEWKKLKEKHVIKTKNKAKKKNKIIKSPTYEELLKDERWLKRRKEIMDKKGYVCSMCNSKIGLVVHHLYYQKTKGGNWKKPWDYPDDALIVLCSKCHKEIHNK